MIVAAFLSFSCEDLAFEAPESLLSFYMFIEHITLC